MKKWQSFCLAAFGISIPVIAYYEIFVLDLPGPIYFLAVTPIYIALTFYLAKKNQDFFAKKVIGKWAMAGFLVSVFFSGLALFFTNALEGIFSFVALVFPPAIFWMALDTPGGNPTISNIAIVYTTAITANVILYALYGCIVYYMKKLFKKRAWVTS